MKKYIRYGVLALAMGAVSISTPALADEDEGFYFGVSAGQSEFADFDKGDLDGAFAAALTSAGVIPGAISSRADDRDTTFAFFSGYRFSPYVAAELGYTDLGTATYRGSSMVSVGGVFGVPARASTTIDFESKGVVASALGAYPFSDVFDVHGRLGLLFSDTELKVGVNVDDGSSPSSFTQRISNSAVDGFFSVGAGFTFIPNWHLSLDFQVFNDVGDNDTGEMNVRTLSLSLAYRL